MEHLWSSGASDVKATHQAVGLARRITSNTIQSTMERLHRKGLLAREKVSHAYVYSPKLTREEVRARIVEDVVARVAGGGTDTMLSTFVDLAARAGKETLHRLERMVAERRAKVEGERR